AGFYRDVLAGKLGASVTPIHVDTAELSAAAAERWSAEGALRRLEAVLACRAEIDANVKPRIAVEAMMLALWRGWPEGRPARGPGQIGTTSREVWPPRPPHA